MQKTPAPTAREHEILVACALPPDELKAREEDLMVNLFSAVQERRELADGYAFRFSPTPDRASEVLRFVIQERECCPFFHFEIHFEPGGGPLWLYLRGPEGTKEFLESFGSAEE
jgi:hypothetical protein